MQSILSLPLAALGSFLVPSIILAAVIALVILGLVVASRYKTVPPNGIGVFYGRSYPYSFTDSQGVTKTAKRGFHIVTGGGKILLPIVEQYQVMSTAAFQVAIEEQGVPTAKNVPVKIEAMATCRISPNPDEQANAVQAFLGKTPDAIANTVSEILRGHVRSIIAGLTVEQILRDRAEFNRRVLDESADEFKRLGIQIITLVVQDVSDEVGYIAALGKQETAGTIRDAAIATANAEKTTKIEVSNAQREASLNAAANAAKVADAEKDRDIQIAQFKVETETKKAQADMANSIAKATQEKQLRVIEADRDTAAAQAGIGVQEQKAKLRERELNATIITEANAKKAASLIDAEAQQQVAERTAKRVEIEANGRAAATVKDGEAQATRTRAIATADADATKVRLTAEADGTRATQLAIAAGVEANSLATAKGTEANLLATANGKRAALLAEAEGTEKLNEALATMSDSAKLIFILERLPNLLDKGGDAGAKMLAAVFTPLGESLGAIKNVSIVDMGGKDGGNGVAKFAGSIPEAIAGMVAKAEALGIDVKPLLKLTKIDASKLKDMIGMVDAVVPEADVS